MTNGAKAERSRLRAPDLTPLVQLAGQEVHKMVKFASTFEVWAFLGGMRLARYLNSDFFIKMPFALFASSRLILAP